ncbi:MAG: hypothetical protein JSV05_06060 [Candidatus Bathyarchaeota archaeon]|nr:MAG: hypothetical protein JSV05_06060 [Candidatus Bathyarchaeota archaeon]
MKTGQRENHKELVYGVVLGLLFGLLGNFLVEYWFTWHPPTQEVAEQGFFITLFTIIILAIIFFVVWYLLHRRRE